MKISYFLFVEQKVGNSHIIISENYSLGKAMSFLEKSMAEIAPSNKISWKGKSEELKETSNELYIIFALALLTAYLVMAATFNSFVHPFIIILTVPLAVFGGLIFILFLNSSINIFSQIALIILIGISTKNSILIVDYSNQLRAAGKSIEVAVKEACLLRFRPIIMTTLAMVLGALPLIFGSGLMYMSRANLGITIIGGLIIGTIFSLFIVPLVYTLVKKSEHYDY